MHARPIGGTRTEGTLRLRSFVSSMHKKQPTRHAHAHAIQRLRARWCCFEGLGCLWSDPSPQAVKLAPADLTSSCFLPCGSRASLHALPKYYPHALRPLGLSCEPLPENKLPLRHELSPANLERRPNQLQWQPQLQRQTNPIPTTTQPLPMPSEKVYRQHPFSPDRKS